MKTRAIPRQKRNRERVSALSSTDNEAKYNLLGIQINPLKLKTKVVFVNIRLQII